MERPRSNSFASAAALEVVAFLEKHDVALRVLTEQIDTSTPGGGLVFHLFGVLAEFERDLISERTRVGLAAARARGRTGGRPTVLTAQKRPELGSEDVALLPMGSGRQRRP